MQKITPFLWFDSQAEEAANYYVSVFSSAGKPSKILNTSRYSDEGPGPKGSVMVLTFQLGDQNFMALNGGPQFKLSPAVSLLVNCDTQQEIDELWEKLSEGGRKDQCGWLADKYGLSWQIVPSTLGELMKDPEKAKRVMHAILQMKKLDIKTLKQAAEQGL